MRRDCSRVSAPEAPARVRGRNPERAARRMDRRGGGTYRRGAGAGADLAGARARGRAAAPPAGRDRGHVPARRLLPHPAAGTLWRPRSPLRAADHAGGGSRAQLRLERLGALDHREPFLDSRHVPATGPGRVLETGSAAHARKLVLRRAAEPHAASRRHPLERPLAVLQQRGSLRRHHAARHDAGRGRPAAADFRVPAPRAIRDRGHLERGRAGGDRQQRRGGAGRFRAGASPARRDDDASRPHPGRAGQPALSVRAAAVCRVRPLPDRRGARRRAKARSTRSWTASATRPRSPM